jgi:hypothetical protein
VEELDKQALRLHFRHPLAVGTPKSRGHFQRLNNLRFEVGRLLHHPQRKLAVSPHGEGEQHRIKR